jgi:Bardet-Biedl syndrome 2 protein
VLLFFIVLSFQVLIHSPHVKKDNAQGLTDISLLNINQQVISVATGRLDENSEKDSLLVGTATNLMAYDVDRNADLFYKDVREFSSA